MVLVPLATLLMLALLIMFGYSRKAVKEEALQKAAQTLEATVQHIDNILLSVEQSTGNIYWKMLNYLNQPDKTKEYCRKLVEGNPYVVDCHLVMDADSNAINMIGWIEPMEGNGQLDEAVISFSLPVYQGGKKVGLLVADVSLTLLSKIVLDAKPSPNSFCTLLDHNGGLIVSPDSSTLSQNIFTVMSQENDSSFKDLAQAMLSGETGYRHIKLDGEDCYVFYKPFERSDVPGRSGGELGWSVGIFYPENDIFGDYNLLLYMVLAIAVTGLLLLLLLCQTFIHRQFLPLRLLAKSSQRIAEGYYDEMIPESRQQDEVGRLQNHFQQMQLALATHVNELKQLSDTLQERGEVLQAAYEQAEGAERMKTSFLYNMSNQMMAPANGIYSSVMAISGSYKELTEEEINHQVDEIQLRGEKITGLLNQLIADSEKE
jgi:methyl-accepting chemotaxis protein/sigma-B regulation protein RsbU (phosphoserine phosphatase)